MEKEKQGNIILIFSIYGVVRNDQRLYEGSNLAKLYTDEEEKKENSWTYSI